MPVPTPLVNARAGQRLIAKLVDWMPALAVGVVGAVVLPGILADDGAWPAGLLVAAGVVAVYLIGLLIWEGMSGKTPGNLLLRLRTTGRDGLAPGVGGSLLRGVVLAVSWLVPVIGPVLMLVSNRWDPDHQRRGWHDKAAGTLMVDVGAGRDPLSTGGLFGSRSDDGAAPEGASAAFAEPRVQDQVQPQLQTQQRPSVAAPVAPIDSVPKFGADVPPADVPPADVPPAVEPTAAIAPVVSPEDQPVHLDAELEMTRIARSQPAAAGVQLVFDDGAVVRVPGSALLGRNPSRLDDETVDQLIDFADLSRSVSKTHLHLRADGNGVWVTDRNSTNGSAASTPNGVEEDLTPEQPVLVPVGSTVQFGDRHFVIHSA